MESKKVTTVGMKYTTKHNTILLVSILVIHSNAQGGFGERNSTKLQEQFIFIAKRSDESLSKDDKDPKECSKTNESGTTQSEIKKLLKVQKRRYQ